MKWRDKIKLTIIVCYLFFPSLNKWRKSFHDYFSLMIKKRKKQKTGQSIVEEFQIKRTYFSHFSVELITDQWYLLIGENFFNLFWCNVELLWWESFVHPSDKITLNYDRWIWFRLEANVHVDFWVVQMRGCIKIRCFKRINDKLCLVKWRVQPSL